MPKVTEEHRQAMRERIHQAALRAIRVSGVQGVSMAEIIRESGLSAGAIYGYYRSKDDIIVAAAGQVLASRLDIIAEFGSRRPVPTIAELIRALMQPLPMEFAGGGLVLELWSLAPREPAIRELATAAAGRLFAMMSDYLERLALDRGVEASAAEQWAAEAAPALGGLCQGYLAQVTIFGDDAGERYLKAVAAMGFSLPN